MGQRGTGWTDTSQEAMDSAAREHQERMAAKTAYLKSLAVDIETESKDSHRLLGGLGDDMDGSSGLMGGTLSRVTALLGSGRSNRQVMCYVVGGVVAAFILIYYFVSRS